MTNILLYNALAYVYLCCTVLYLAGVVLHLERAGRAATMLTCGAAAVHAGAFVLRWVESVQLGMGHLPIRGPYECLTFSAGAVVGLYLVAERMLRSRAFGAAVLPVVALMMMVAAMLPAAQRGIAPMPEVLQGNYIGYHLFSCFAGYAAFAVACVAGALVLLHGRVSQRAGQWLQGRGLSRDRLDSVNYRMATIGFLMFSVMIVTGMLRSRIIWGRYWDWDPVQTWSFLAWIVYAAMLHGGHGRYMGAGFRAVLSIVGFALALVSFLIGAGFVDVSRHFPIRG